jgi:hypothetical protein
MTAHGQQRRFGDFVRWMNMDHGQEALGTRCPGVVKIGGQDVLHHERACGWERATAGAHSGSSTYGLAHHA